MKCLSAFGIDHLIDVTKNQPNRVFMLDNKNDKSATFMFPFSDENAKGMNGFGSQTAFFCKPAFKIYDGKPINLVLLTP